MGETESGRAFGTGLVIVSPIISIFCGNLASGAHETDFNLREIDFIICFDSIESQTIFRVHRKKILPAATRRSSWLPAAVLIACQFVDVPANPVRNFRRKYVRDWNKLTAGADDRDHFRNRLHGILVRPVPVRGIAHFPSKHEKRKKRFRLANRS
jgi:hypothetical protein